MDLTTDFPLSQFRKKPCVKRARVAFVGFTKSGKAIPTDVMEYIVGDIEKQIARDRKKPQPALAKKIVAKITLAAIESKANGVTQKQVYQEYAELFGIISKDYDGGEMEPWELLRERVRGYKKNKM